MFNDLQGEKQRREDWSMPGGVGLEVSLPALFTAGVQSDPPQTKGRECGNE